AVFRSRRLRLDRLAVDRTHRHSFFPHVSPIIATHYSPRRREERGAKRGEHNKIIVKPYQNSKRKGFQSFLSVFLRVLRASAVNPSPLAFALAPGFKVRVHVLVEDLEELGDD